MKRFAAYLIIASTLFTSTWAQPNTQPKVGSGKIKIAGSDSMLLLGIGFGSLFKRRAPGVEISVNGGGNGLAALESGKAEIAQSLAASRHAGVVEFPVGIESVVFYVNAKNSVRALSFAQLKAIYTGKVTNWKEVGGADAPIHLYSTERPVGGSTFVRETVLAGDEFYDVMRGFNNLRETVDAVAGDANGIGFGSFLANPSVRMLAIKTGSGTIEGSLENVRSARYPVSRYLYWQVKSQSTPLVRSFCDWVLSAEGQLVVESQGYFPLNAADRNAASEKLRVLPNGL